MTYNITLTANHQSLTAEYLPLAAESVQYLTAKVVCETEDWTGREIKAMFGQGCTEHEVSVTNGEITAKQQLNLSAGDWCVWLVGNSARDGEVIPRITTNVAHISVAPTGGTEGNPFPVIPPTAEEQLRADMGNLANLTTEDKSSLVAAINEAAASGGSKDAVTYTPQTLTVEQQAQARTNIGALDVNIETTPVDTNRTFFGVGKNIVYVKNGWLKPCPADADKELADNYANAVLGFGFINTDISVVKAEAKSAFSLYQQGLISDKGTILKNPLDVAQYITWTVGTTNNKTYIDYRHVEHKGFYEYCRYFEDDTYSYPRASYSLSNDMSDSKPRGSVAQYAMSANPTKDMHIATKQYVDTAKTEAQQLGLTSATPGQIIKVKAVQDGKPTEWEATWQKWEKIAAITLTDAAVAITQNFGREYAEIIIVDTVPVVAEGAALGIKADGEDVFFGAEYIASTGAYARQRVYHMYPLDGYLVTDADQANANINKKNSLTLLRQSATYSKDTIGSLYYYARSTDVLLPSGTKLEIYGVRA